MSRRADPKIKTLGKASDLRDARLSNAVNNSKADQAEHRELTRLGITPLIRLGITTLAVQKIKEDKDKLREKYLEDLRLLLEGQSQLKQLKINQQATRVPPPPPVDPALVNALYSSIITDHGYGAKENIIDFFQFFVPYMVTPPPPLSTVVTCNSLKITVDIGLHSYLIVRTEGGVDKDNVINLYLDECVVLPANVNVITGNTMNSALLEENTLNFKHYLLTGPSLNSEQIIAELNKLQPTIAHELKTRIAASILRARATGKLVNQAFPAWASEYEGAIEEIDRLLRCHIMHISSTPHYQSVRNRTLHNRFCSIDPDDWKFTVKHPEVLNKQPPAGFSPLGVVDAPNLAFTILVRVDLCYGGQNYGFSLRLDREALQTAKPNLSCIFKYSDIIQAFQSVAFREYLLDLIKRAIAASTTAAADFLNKAKDVYNIHAHQFFSLFASRLQSLWSSATFEIIETGCASIAKCIDQTDGKVKTLRLKCYDALTHQDQLCNGIYLMGLPCINPNFRQLFFPDKDKDDNIITQVRFCLRFQNNHQNWVQTINTFDSERSDDIIDVRSGNICPSMSSSSGDTGTSQDTLTTAFSELVKTDVTTPELQQQFLTPAVIKQEVEAINEGFTKLSEEVTSLNANNTTLYKDKDSPEDPVKLNIEPLVNPGIFSKIASGISGLASAVNSLFGLWRGGTSSRNLLTKTKRKSLRSLSRLSQRGDRGRGGRGRGGRGGGRGSKTRRRPLRRTNKKLK
jgi:hypothetical protein